MIHSNYFYLVSLDRSETEFKYLKHGDVVSIVKSLYVPCDNVLFSLKEGQIIQFIKVAI